jgi:hypothetical protein
MESSVDWIDVIYLGIVAVMLVGLIIWAGNMEDPH